VSALAEIVAGVVDVGAVDVALVVHALGRGVARDHAGVGRDRGPARVVDAGAVHAEGDGAVGADLAGDGVRVAVVSP
jgi:hypothetical protein